MARQMVPVQLRPFCLGKYYRLFLFDMPLDVLTQGPELGMVPLVLWVHVLDLFDQHIKEMMFLEGYVHKIASAYVFLPRRVNQLLLEGCMNL